MRRKEERRWAELGHDFLLKVEEKKEFGGEEKDESGESWIRVSLEEEGKKGLGVYIEYKIFQKYEF